MTVHHPRAGFCISGEGDIARLAWADEHRHHLLLRRGRHGLAIDVHYRELVAVDVHGVEFGTADVDDADAHTVAAVDAVRFGQGITLAVDAEVVFGPAEHAPR